MGHTKQTRAHTPQTTAHTKQTTAHRPQTTAHRKQTRAHKPQTTAHTKQTRAHTPQTTAHRKDTRAHQKINVHLARLHPDGRERTFRNITSQIKRPWYNMNNLTSHHSFKRKTIVLMITQRFQQPLQSELI